MKFLQDVRRRAAANPRRIVFPESADPRTLTAVETLLREGIVRPVLVLDPARHIDSEPLNELQCLHRAADREREDDRCRFEVTSSALVVIVGDQVLRGIDVIDDLGDKERATCHLLRQQTDVLPAPARVPPGIRDTR